MSILVLDGPMGTELGRRGVPLPEGVWSAWAIEHDPDEIVAIHAEYARAGATVHTTNTFRTRRRSYPDRWAALTAQAVGLARMGVPAGHRVAGSIAPLEDCYSPWLSPAEPRPEHREMARALAAAGVDLLLCETFPHVGEGLVAVEEAVATGLETWASFTAGPDADLLSPAELAAAARQAVARGARAVLVNCVPATATLAYVERLAELGVPFGAYANAGHAAEGLGWERPTPDAAARYADLAASWVGRGASLVGGCCGTGPAHIAELRRRFGPPAT